VLKPNSITIAGSKLRTR